jgi:hypothetical protein
LIDRRNGRLDLMGRVEGVFGGVETEGVQHLGKPSLAWLCIGSRVVTVTWWCSAVQCSSGWVSAVQFG